MKTKSQFHLMLATVIILAAALIAGLGCGDSSPTGQDNAPGDVGLDVLVDHDVGPDAVIDTATTDALADTTDVQAELPLNDLIIHDIYEDVSDAADSFDTGSDSGNDVWNDANEDNGGGFDFGLDTARDSGSDIQVTDIPSNPDISDLGTQDLATQDPGASDTAADVPQLIAINYVVPESAVENTGFTISVIGTGFTAGMQIRIVGDNPLTSGYSADAQSLAFTIEGKQIDAAFANTNGLIKGFYRVELLEDLNVLDSLSGFKIVSSSAVVPVITSVTPDTAQSGRDRLVQLAGTGFAEGATVVLTGYGEAYECSYVDIADSETATAVVTSGTNHIPVGEYEVWIINADGLSGKWDGVFKVSDLAPPTILAISPARAGNANSLTMTVQGLDFQEGALVSFITLGADIPLTAVQDAETFATLIQATVPAGLVQGVYPVRVTNPDNQYDIFYFYQISNNSPGSLTTFETMSETLNTPRWQHGLDAMIDGMGHGFLVVTGGMVASGMPLDDVEVSQIAPDGTPQKWKIPYQTDPMTGMRIVNRMNEPRTGAASVRVGKTLFIAGGRSLPDGGSPAIDTIEKAQILSSSGIPRVKTPVPSINGLLPEGRWLYRVSAVRNSGETLASNSVSYRGAAGALSLAWEPVQGAVSYNIYRCPSANCSSGQETAVAWMLDATLGRTFTDDGQGILTPSPAGFDAQTFPDDPDALSQVQYSYKVTSVVESEGSPLFESVPGPALTVTVPGGTGLVSLFWNEVAAATSYRIYRAQGSGPFLEIFEIESGTTSFDDTLETTASNITPPTQVKPLPSGSLSLFEYVVGPDSSPILLNIPREGARATFVETQFDETDPDALTGVILITGGRSGFEPLPAAISTVESIPLFIDGSFGSPALEDVELKTGRAFFGLGNSQDRLDNLTFEDDDDDDPVTPDCPDADHDGFFDAACGGKDCDDHNAMINPAADENLLNGIDDNCDGLIDVPTQGWENASRRPRVLVKRETTVTPEPVFLLALFGNNDVKAFNDTGLRDIEAVGVDLTTGHLLELNSTPVLDWTLQFNTDNGDVHGINVALYQQFLFSFMGVGSENLGQVPTTLAAQSKRFPFCPVPEPADPGDASFGCPGYSNWTYHDLAGIKRTSANATVSGGLGYYGLSRAFGYIYIVAGVTSEGVSGNTYRVLQ